MVRRVALAILLVLFVACSDNGSSVLVNLRTDYAPTVEFSQVRIFLAADGAVGEDVLMHAARDIDYVEGQRIASFEDVSLGSYRVRVRA